MVTATMPVLKVYIIAIRIVMLYGLGAIKSFRH